MTTEEVYALLGSKIYYEQEGSKKFTFTNNSIHIDRRAFVPFDIYMEKENFYLNPDTAIAAERELRIEIDKNSAIHFYGKTSGEKLLTLQ
jgi:hypothetical protein